MKKIALLLSGIALFINTSKAQKAFEKGTVAVSAGIGFAVYGTKLHNEYTSGLKRIVEDENSAAASTVIPFTVEYGFTNWLGIGARFAYSKYIAESDSSNNNARPKITGFDGDLTFNFHFIKSKRFDMPLSFIVGYSSFKYQANNPNTSTSATYDNGNAIAKDNGMNYGIALVPRIYFGDHVGIYFNLGYMGYNYPSLVFSNNSDQNLNNDNNQDQLFTLKGNGGNIGLGLIVKF